MYALAGALKIALPHAVGIMEMLWHFAAQYAPEGDIGSFPDQEIASAVGWEKKPALLIDGLVSTGWIHSHEEHRLYVHDWPDHCEQSVERLLKRNRKTFLEVYSHRLASDESVTSQRLDSHEARLGKARQGSEVFSKENQDAPILNKPARTEFEPDIAVALRPPLDGEFERLIGALLAGGAKFNEGDVAAAKVFWAGVPVEQRKDAADCAERMARATEGHFLGLPQNFIRKSPWTRDGPGRLLPPPVTPSKVELAQQGAEKSFLARKRAEGR